MEETNNNIDNKDLFYAKLLENLIDQEEDGDESAFDWKALIGKLWSKRKYFYISMPVTFVVAAILALGIPRYYKVQVKLAPELGGVNTSSLSGGLSSMLRSFGLSSSMSAGKDVDAIMPNLYPDLMNSKVFLVSLFDVPVQNKNKDLNTTYYDYLENHQKSAWWRKAIGGTIGALTSLLPKSDAEGGEALQPDTVNAGALSLKQTGIAKAIAGKINCDVDKKTYVITIDVTDQDPAICCAMADSTCHRLQDFITKYRTKKAQQELNNVQAQYDKAQQEYEEAKVRAAAYTDANWDLVDQQFVVEQQSIQNEMQLKNQILTMVTQQLIQAQAKLEGARPVFTVLDGASVPVQPAGPSRAKFVLMWCFLVALVQTVWLLRKDLKELL